jgi:uncharacterized protein YgbK (DUF1537 family)
MCASSIYFKYCSTFDSTPVGNIGPVAEALQNYLGAAFVPLVPAFPENGRRVFRGHLFVGDELLNESGMQSHPLNPMRDPNLVRVLSAQSRAGVGLVNRDTIKLGVPAVIEALTERAREGKPLVILDSIDDEDLETIAEALLHAPLVSGSSALGFHIARRLAAQGNATTRPDASASVTKLSPRPGRTAVLAGSCSRRTLEQISHFREHRPCLHLPVERLLRGEDVVPDVMRWFEAQSADGPSLIFTSAAPDALACDKRDSPGHSIGRRIEETLAAVAHGLIALNVKRMIVAGGETSGAVVERLGIRALKIGPEITPGVPWTQVDGAGPAEGVCMALKSGNFGASDFFIQAFDLLDSGGRSA